MKQITYFFFFSFFLLGLYSCEKLEENMDAETPNLHIKFENSIGSEFTITQIQVRPRGSASTITDATAEWSENILEENAQIEIGNYVYFDLPIPSGEWYEYRLAVLDEQNTELWLHEQTATYDTGNLPITHWGSDERTVSVTIKKSTDTGLIIVTGWTDFAGID